MQLAVVNRPIPADLIGRKRFFDASDPATAAYAEEYNRILNDKMREGVSNLVRERYLTFSVGAASIADAIPKLARMRTDAEQTLAKMRSASRPLSGEERLDAIHGLLRPGKPNLFSWEAVGAAGGLTSKDLICPASLDFKPEGSGTCFKTEDTWGQVLSINRFGSELSDRCLADIIDPNQVSSVTILDQKFPAAE